MKKTNYARRMDSSGRIVLPSRLRENLGVNNNTMYDFFIHTHEDDVYLCINVGKRADIVKNLTEKDNILD